MRLLKEKLNHQLERRIEYLLSLVVYTLWKRVDVEVYLDMDVDRNVGRKGPTTFFCIREISSD